MRFDKFTTKFQQALADAQSLAVGQDNQFIEPQHLLLALISDPDSGAASLLARAGGNVVPLRSALNEAIERLPKVEGHGGEVQVGRDLNNLLNLTDKAAQKRGDQFIASEMFLLAACDDKGETGRLLKQHGVGARAAGAGNQHRARRRNGRFAGSRRPARSAEEIHHRPDRARPPRQARSGDRARRRDPPRDPGIAAPHQEQPGIDRRTGRGQDRDRRRPGATHRQRRSAGIAEGQESAVAWTWRHCWPARNIAASSRNA